MKISKCVGVHRLFGLLALSAILLFVSCKKDEATPGAEQAAGQGEKTEQAEKAAAEGKAPAEGKTEAKGDEAGEPTKAAPAKALAPAQHQAVPDQIIAFGSVKSFTDLVAVVKELATKFGAGPMVANLDQMMLQGLQGGLGFQSIDWYDKSRPARIVVLNPKTNPQPAVVVLPITDAEATKKALPAEKKENDAGNQFSYTHEFQTFYANIAGKDLVLTQSPEAFALVKDFVDKTLAGHTPDVPFEISVAMDNVQKIFGQELAMAEAQIQQMAAMPGMMPVPGLEDVLKKEYELIFQGVRELTRIDIAFTTREGRLQLPMTFTVKEDGGIAKFIQGMAGRKVGLVDLLPASSYVVMGYNVNPEAAAAWSDLGLEFIGKAFQFEGDKLEKLRSLYEKSLAVTTGDTAFALYRDGNLSFALDVAYGITDAKKARDAHYAFYGMIWDELVAFGKKMAEKEGQQIPPQLDLSSFAATIKSLNGMAAPMGVAISLNSEEYKGVTIDYLDLKIDFTKLPPMGEQEKAIVDAIVGDHFQFAIGYADGFMFQTLSPNAVAHVKQAIDGEKPLANDASFAYVSDLLKDGGGVLFIDPIKGVKAFSAVPELAPMKSAIDAKKPNGGLVLDTDAVAGNQLRMTIDVATDPIGEMVQMFGGGM